MVGGWGVISTLFFYRVPKKTLFYFGRIDRQVMEEAAGKSAMTKFSISDMESELQLAMRQNAGAREVKPLRECCRGVVVEEMVDHDGELRVLVLHGTVQVAATDRGVEVWRGKDGKWEFSKEEALQGLQERWAEVESCSLGEGLELLRVDFFLRRTGADLRLEMVANEMCAFLWPESRFFRPCYPHLLRQMKKGGLS